MRSRPGWVLVAGLVEIVLGLIAIVWPAVASVSIAILLGILLLISGGVAFVTAFAAPGWHLFGRLLWSFFSGLGGLYLLVFPDEGLVGLTAVLVIVMFLSGTAFVALGLFGGGNRGVLLAVGAIDILVGAFAPRVDAGSLDGRSGRRPCLGVVRHLSPAPASTRSGHPSGARASSRGAWRGRTHVGRSGSD